jgi:hypothetical protein
VGGALLGRWARGLPVATPDPLDRRALPPIAPHPRTLPAGKPPDGERKLYLLIEGPTQEVVRAGKNFIKKVRGAGRAPRGSRGRQRSSGRAQLHGLMACLLQFPPTPPDHPHPHPPPPPPTTPPPKVIEEMTEKAMRKDMGAAGGRYSIM